jgi:hypothetical protein
MLKDSKNFVIINDILFLITKFLRRIIYMKYQFKALPDFEEIINEKLENLCKKFNKFPQTIVNINTKILSSGMIRYDIEILNPEVKYEGYSHVATL